MFKACVKFAQSNVFSGIVPFVATPQKGAIRRIFKIAFYRLF